LALLLALARLRPCPLLLLDEMDAALDESNAAKVAALLAELSATCQVIAISHRVELHRAAHHIVRRATDQKVRSLAQLILTQLPDRALLESDLQALPTIYRQAWPRAAANSFLLQAEDQRAIQV
jgi:ABC-type transport system involved in cytochrome bd biosynthesis fused ATPase/permease subunit